MSNVQAILARLHNAVRALTSTDAHARRDRALATLAHELRNPLSAIVDALRALERFGAPPVEAGRLRALIGRQAKHLTRLVEDLLDVARLPAGVVVRGGFRSSGPSWSNTADTSPLTVMAPARESESCNAP
jgi:signal transduction histidine kinase